MANSEYVVVNEYVTTAKQYKMDYSHISPTWITWTLAIYAAFQFGVLLMAQAMMLFKPKSQSTKELLIGKDQDWRDHTHFRSAKAMAWADWLILFPLWIIGSYGVLVGQWWGYLSWICLGVVSIYFSILTWVLEKKYTYPNYGPLAYYTYYWGGFLYWGIAAIGHSLVRIMT